MTRVKLLVMAAVVGATALVPGVSQAEGPTFTKVVAKDYKFLGVLQNPVDAGLYKFGFKNNGERPHEFVMIKNKSGLSNRAFLDSVGNGEPDEADYKFMGASFAKPGKKGEAFTTYLKPGRYMTLCFISNGKDAPPHYQKGMLRGFTVQ